MNYTTILKPRLIRSSWLELDVSGNKVIAIKDANSNRKVNGYYSKLGDVLLGIFCLQKELLVMVDTRIHSTSAKDFGISHQPDGNHSVLHIESERCVHNINYETGEPVSTIFYSEDQEDVDFGLWVLNVLNSNERRDLCVAHWSNDAG